MIAAGAIEVNAEGATTALFPTEQLVTHFAAGDKTKWQRRLSAEGME
jgi:hypothetical protein